MKTLIAGCGYLGCRLGLELAARGQDVWGLRRDWRGEEARKAVSSGIQPIFADLLDPESLKGLPETERVVFCQAPKKESDSYRTTYGDGTRNLLSVLKNPTKIILISSTGVYAAQGGVWVDERTDPKPEGDARWLLEAERAVLQSGLNANVFRLGGLYGPGRHRLRLIRERKLKLSFSDVFVNRIHVDDAVAGILLLFDKGSAGEIYLGVDDKPSTQAEFYSWLFGQWREEFPNGGSPAEASPAHGSNKRCSNQKIKALGFKFRYPSFREGYAALLKEA
jgi:nucleoside-diphosphate-sugar epimerase